MANMTETVKTPELRTGDRVMVSGFEFGSGTPATILEISAVAPTGGRDQQTITVASPKDGHRVHLGGTKSTDWERVR